VDTRPQTYIALLLGANALAFAAFAVFAIDEFLTSLLIHQLGLILIWAMFSRAALSARCAFATAASVLVWYLMPLNPWIWYERELTLTLGSTAISVLYGMACWRLAGRRLMFLQDAHAPVPRYERQFSLRRMMGWIVAISIPLAAARAVVDVDWFSGVSHVFAIIGVVHAIVLLAAVWVALWPGALSRRLLLLGVIALILVAAEAWQRYRHNVPIISPHITFIPFFIGYPVANLLVFRKLGYRFQRVGGLEARS
jgi:hypothetical protein